MSKSHKEAVSFFYEHAGYGYDPAKETPEQGRQNCAEMLADAEMYALNHGYTFEWTIDEDSDSSDFCEGEPYPLWICQMFDSNGWSAGHLCGIDLGSDGSPHNNHYVRVIEAELAADINR